jgi:hypothetical protein
VRTDRNSLFPIVIIVFGAVLMIGALLWFVVVTRQSAARTTVLSTPVVSSITPAAASITPVASPAIPYPEMKRISLADAKAAYDLKSAIFIDVRGEPYYSEGHIPGALSMTNDELPSRMGELDKKAWIIPYCT